MQRFSYLDKREVLQQQGRIQGGGDPKLHKEGEDVAAF